jgi:hypothetical protein
MNAVAEELLLEFLHQKKQLAERAGVKHTPAPDWTLATHIWGKHMSEMANIVQDWDIAPAIVMQAAFDQAKRNRHPDGPQVTMLKSDKYLTNALSMHLDLPVAAIRERRGQTILLEIMDKEFDSVKFPEDLLGFTVEDPCFRYVEARRRGEEVTAVMLAREVLQRTTDDRRMDKWLEYRGYPYLDIAQHYHRISEKLITMPPLPTS